MEYIRGIITGSLFVGGIVISIAARREMGKHMEKFVAELIARRAAKEN